MSFLSALGPALSIGSSIAGGLGGGKGKAPTQVSGYASLPGDKKDVMSGEVWQKILEQFRAPHQGLPRRRLSTEGYDPVFGSRAQQDIQAYKDQLAVMRAQEGATPTESGESTGDIEARMRAREYLLNGGTGQRGQGDVQKQMLSGGKYDNAGLASIGKYLMAKDTGKNTDADLQAFMMALDKPMRA